MRGRVPSQRKSVAAVTQSEVQQEREWGGRATYPSSNEGGSLLRSPRKISRDRFTERYLHTAHVRYASQERSTGPAGETGCSVPSRGKQLEQRQEAFERGPGRRVGQACSGRKVRRGGNIRGWVVRGPHVSTSTECCGSAAMALKLAERSFASTGLKINNRIQNLR